MGTGMTRIEVQVWREAGDSGAWRCRLIAPEGRHTVRLDDQSEVSAYIAEQLDALLSADNRAEAAE
jgi:hypothetical protein